MTVKMVDTLHQYEVFHLSGVINPPECFIEMNEAENEEVVDYFCQEIDRRIMTWVLTFDLICNTRYEMT